VGRRPSATAVGAFVVGAAALAVAGVLAFGSGRLFRHAQRFVLYFDSSVNGLRVGAAVKFKGVEVGSVDQIALNLTGARRTAANVSIPVVIELDADKITKRGAPFDIVSPRMMEGLVREGLRGQLGIESIVTGVLYVDLDFHPGTPIKLVSDPRAPYPEIPTIPTPLEEVQARAARIVAELDEIDVRRLADSVTDAVDGVKRLVTSPKVQAAADGLDDAVKDLGAAAKSVRRLADDADRGVTPLAESLRESSRRAAAALDQAQATFRSLQALVGPGAPAGYELERALTEISAAAHAVAELADYLQRNPGAVVRGRLVPEGGR